MNVAAFTRSELIADESSVWRLSGHDEFAYSDGTSSEKYLERVFQNAADLSSRSEELQASIRDWPSEYHLSAKRVQLLSGFKFDRTMKVLEVGCGCGAITRFLGENFDQVISIEGSLARARLARLRTRDLSSVSIICAPFQDIDFSQKFDVIFCIGVLEYSALFVKGEDPYSLVLKYFADMLEPDGVLVVAIENQFGLKYLNGFREDHVGLRFEGFEGYHRTQGVRTFGKGELERRLKEHFPVLRFYYPFPDYKLPDIILSSDLLASGKAGEIVSQARSRDYFGYVGALWNEAAVSLELARNGMQEMLANSFLVVASRSEASQIEFDQLAIGFSSGRRNLATCLTRVMETRGGEVCSVKQPLAGSPAVDLGDVLLVGTRSAWHSGYSLQTQLELAARRPGSSLSEIFGPCKAWIQFLRGASSERDSVLYLEGEHVDSIWQNAYIVDSQINFIDREWIWKQQVRLNVIVIRAIYNFVARFDRRQPFMSGLSIWSMRGLIQIIAGTFSIALNSRDFAEFVDLESRFRSSVYNVDRETEARLLRRFLGRHPLLLSAGNCKRRVLSVLTRMSERMAGIRDRLRKLVICGRKLISVG